MDLLSQLKKFQNIQPQESYKASSLEQILLTPKNIPTQNAWAFFLDNIRVGSAIALTAVLLVVTAGSVSLWRTLSPFKLGSLDVSSLRAEAEAIDIQIQLTKVTYPEVQVVSEASEEVAKQSRPVSVEPEVVALKRQAEEVAVEMGISNPSTTTPPTEPTINEALKSLAE